MAANDIADPRVHARTRTVAVASASVDTEASEIMVGILSVHYMVPKYLTGVPGLAGICAGCQWSGRFDSPKDARNAHGTHVLDVLRSNGFDVVGIGEVPADEESGND